MLLISVIISGQSLLGLMPGNGSSLCARESWSRTGRGTVLPWTTLNFTALHAKSENPMNAGHNDLQEKRVDFRVYEYTDNRGVPNEAFEDVNILWCTLISRLELHFTNF